MPIRPKELVFDTWAIIAYYGEEPSGDRVAQIITEANEHGTPMRMSVINVGEVWYIIARKISCAEADTAIAGLRNLGIQFEDADWKTAYQAAIFKSAHRMSYADAFAAAISAHRHAHLVTGDVEFKRLEKEIKVYWV